MIGEWTALENGVHWWMDTITQEDTWVLRLRYNTYVASCTVDLVDIIAADPQEVLEVIESRANDLKAAIDSRS